MFAELLREQCRGFVELAAEQVGALEAHYRMMVRWNKSLNLTKIVDERDAVDRHYAESLFLGAHLPAGALRIADIGSGAGFPGFPVAVLRPDCEVTLIESHQRKAVFLREASRGLGNVRVVANRAEEMSGDFDWVVSRAVSYEDLKGPVERLAPRVALLAGADGPAGWRFRWERAVQVPGGKNRFLKFGTREPTVSRETWSFT